MQVYENLTTCVPNSTIYNCQKKVLSVQMICYDLLHLRHLLKG